MRNNGEVRHTAPEMEMLRQDFILWYFDPFKDPATVIEWAEKNHVTPLWVRMVKKEPSFVSYMEDFRKTYREQGDAALQNLMRFALDENPRVAIPAIKIVTEVMGYNAPQQLEVSTKGMALADYLIYVQESAKKSADEKKALDDGNTIEGEFREDPWETAA